MKGSSWRHIILLCLFLPALFPFQQCRAQDSLVVDEYAQLYNFFLMPTEKRIAVVSHHLYIAVNRHWQGPGIIIADLETEPPQLIATIPTEQQVLRLATSGRLLLELTNESLRFYRTNSVHQLPLRGSYDSGERKEFLDVWAEGSLVVLLCHHMDTDSYNIDLIQIDHSYTPQYRSTIQLTAIPQSVSIMNNQLILDTDGTTSLYDISNPVHPFEYALLAPSEQTPTRLLVGYNNGSETYLYYQQVNPSERDNIVTYEVQEQGNSRRLSAIRLEHDILGALPPRVHDDLMFVPHTNGGTDVYRLGQSIQPEFIGSLDGLLNEVAFEGETAIVSFHLYSSIYRYDFTNRDEPQPLPRIQGRFLRPLGWDNSRRLLFLHDTQQLRLIHLTPEDRLVEVGQTPVPMNRYVIQAGNYLYHYSCDDTFQVVDTTDPENLVALDPWIPDSHTLPALLMASRDGHYMIRTLASGEYLVYDSSVYPPEEVRRFRLYGMQLPLSITTVGTTIFMLFPGSELIVCDFTRLPGAEEVDHFILPYPGLNRLICLDNMLVVMSDEEAICLNLDHPADPVLLGDLRLPPFEHISNGTNWISLSDEDSLRFIRFDQHSQPQYTARPLNESGLPFCGPIDRIIVENGQRLTLLRLVTQHLDAIETDPSQPNGIKLAGIYPNPFNGRTVIQVEAGHQATLHLSLYNLLGQQVCDLAPCRVQPGQNRIQLNLNDVSSGTFFLRSSDGHGFNAVRRITLIR